MSDELEPGNRDDSVVGMPYNDGTGRLSVGGQAFVASWLDAHGSGAGLLRVAWPADCHTAIAAGLTAVDLEQHSRYAVVLAAISWEPAKGKFTTHLSWRLRQVIQRATDEVLYVPRRAKIPVRPLVWSLEASERESGNLTDAQDREQEEDDIRRQSEASVTVSSLREWVLVGFDGKRRWNVVCMRHGLGGRSPMTLRQIAVEIGVSKERVRQILASARMVIRKEFPHLNVT